MKYSLKRLIIWITYVSIPIILFQRPLRNLNADIVGQPISFIKTFLMPIWWILWLFYQENLFETWDEPFSISALCGLLCGISLLALCVIYLTAQLICYGFEGKFKWIPFS